MTHAPTNGLIGQPFPRIALLALGCLIASWLTGCAAPVAPSTDTISVSVDRYDEAFKTSIDTLRAHRFVIDREDYRFGHISTLPRSSSSAFEFWKGEHVTFNDAATSTLNDQQRIVMVLLEPAGDNYELRVEVVLERMQNPDRILTGSTDGHAITGRLGAIPAEQKRNGTTGQHWRKVGRDGHMERALLQAISARLNSLATSTP